jgi:hypothetical protein
MPSIKSIRMAELVNDATFRSDLLRLHGMAHTILFEHRGPHPTRRRSGNWLARLRRSWKRWWRTCMRPSNSFINWRNWRRKSLARAARTWRRRIFKSCISAKPRLPITRTYVNCERIAGIVVGRRPFHEYLSLVDSPDPGNDCPCAGRVPFCANFIAEARNIGWSRSLAMMCRRCAGRAYHGSARILFVMRRS